MKEVVFYRLFNSNLLFYSWNQLKVNSYLFSYFSKDQKFPSFSYLWFKKTALMIKKGTYNYNRKNKKSIIKYKQKRHSINILAQMIIELSFVNIMIYCKRRFFDFDLAQCLRCLKGTMYICLLTFLN